MYNEEGHTVSGSGYTVSGGGQFISTQLHQRRFPDSLPLSFQARRKVRMQCTSTWQSGRARSLGNRQKTKDV